MKSSTEGRFNPGRCRHFRAYFAHFLNPTKYLPKANIDYLAYTK
jgi:hypothetical protein